MLIKSHRHTAADLKLWAEYYAADRMHADLINLRVVSAMRAIEMFLQKGPAYLSVSWGKDSVCVAHLVHSIAPDTPTIHVRQSNELPETLLVRDAFFERWPMSGYRETFVSYDDSEHVTASSTKAFDKLFFAAFDSMGERRITGIRAEESGGRRVRMRTHGLASINALAPIGWWKAADVYAYLAKHDLPTHPSYAMLGGGRWKRGRLRVDGLGGAGGDQFGRAEWEKEYYGDVLRRLAAGRGIE